MKGKNRADERYEVNRFLLMGLYTVSFDGD
jgi:hypothetical protein